MPEKHKMELVKRYDTGATEWQCMICERRTVMQASPFKSISLVEGDIEAQHYGGNINIGISSNLSLHSKGKDIKHH
ncbi:MAG: hypothetical protein ACWA44_11900 [Thiotrichales bacterium]